MTRGWHSQGESFAVSMAYHTLGGEGWPVLDIPRTQQNRKNYRLSDDRPSQVRAGSSRTEQEQAGTVGTPETQPVRFPFRTLMETDMHLILDKDGKRHGPFDTVAQALAYVDTHWPGEEQDSDHPGEGEKGNGWNLGAVRADG